MRLAAVLLQLCMARQCMACHAACCAPCGGWCAVYCLLCQAWRSGAAPYATSALLSPTTSLALASLIHYAPQLQHGCPSIVFLPCCIHHAMLAASAAYVPVPGYHTRPVMTLLPSPLSHPGGRVCVHHLHQDPLQGRRQGVHRGRRHRDGWGGQARHTAVLPAGERPGAGQRDIAWA
jgi:hypothetical protein